jgi:hypothetical protein
MEEKQTRKKVEKKIMTQGKMRHWEGVTERASGDKGG